MLSKDTYTECIWQPFKWFSLWDMLKNYCTQLSSISEALVKLKSQADGGQSNLPSAIRLRRLLENLESLKELLQQLGMRTSEELCSVLLKKLALVKSISKGRPLSKLPEIGRALDSLLDGITAEFKSKLFYYVPNALANYYQENPFSRDIADNFTDAIRDMMEAGKCFALGRYTASVFHLMRVTEHGNEKIRKEYEIAEVKNWSQFLSKLRMYAHAQSGDREKKIMVIHQRVVGLKDAFRDNTMHFISDYNQEEAQAVFSAVRNYMEIVTKKLP